MEKVTLNEQQLNKIIAESIMRVLNESEMEEGLFDKMKSAWNGARQGYQAQKSLDRGTDDFKQVHDYDDVRSTMDNPLKKMDNTAQEQAAQLYQQYKSYQQQANKMLNLYNQICKKYGLVKQGVGNFKTAQGVEGGNGVDFTTGTAGASMKSGPSMKRKTPNRTPNPGLYSAE